MEATQVSKRAGYLKPNLSGDAAYQSYVPSPLPPNPYLTLDKEAISLLVQAHRLLGNLNTLGTHVPDVSLFISMYVRKEALMSSQIEGTQATLEDILDPAVSNIYLPVAEVVNYVRAFNYAIERLQTLPLCNRLLREVHAVLLADTRGQEKNPGEFRRSQNWIGGSGSTLRNTRYIPPNPEDMLLAASDLEKYMHSEDDNDVLLQAALIHYQFETIHPFLDGNGRIGRLLITLYLMEKGVLTTPILYLSYYLKMYRIEYYDRLTEVRNTGNYEQWVKFFLRAICETASDAILTLDRLLALHQRNVEAISLMGTRARQSARSLFDYLEANPIITIRKAQYDLKLSFNTIAAAVTRLMEVGILEQLELSSANRFFAYSDYIAILRDGTELASE